MNTNNQNNYLDSDVAWESERFHSSLPDFKDNQRREVSAVQDVDRPVSNNQTLQDQVRIMDQVDSIISTHPTRVLAELMPGGRQDKQTFTDGLTIYWLKDHWQWENQAVMFGDQTPAGTHKRQVQKQAGMWENTVSGECGYGLLSFVQKALGTDLTTALNWVADRLGVSLHAVDIPQVTIKNRDIFIKHPGYYGPIYPPPHPRMGYPLRSYHFVTEFGQPSVFMGEWFIQGEIVRLFCSSVLDGHTRLPKWVFARPPAEFMLFNKERLHRDKHLPVKIFDSIAEAARLASLPNSVATWAGEKHFAEKMDWKLMAGREVTYYFDSTCPDSFVTCAILREIFKTMKTNLTLIAYGNDVTCSCE